MRAKTASWGVAALLVVSASAVAETGALDSNQWKKSPDGALTMSKKAAEAALEQNKNLIAERDELARRYRKLMESVRKADGKCL